MIKKIMGIDLRRDAISAVLISGGVKGKKIEAHAWASIAGEGEFYSAVSNALESIIETVYDPDAIVMASIPPDMISYRNLTVPFSDSGKIEKVLSFEMEPLLPFPVDDMIIGFLPSRHSGQRDAVNLMAAAVSGEALGLMLEVFKARQPDPKWMIPGGCAIPQCLAAIPESLENFMVVDMDFQNVSLSLVLDKTTVLVRTLAGDAGKKKFPDALCANIRRVLFSAEDILRRPCQIEGIFITGRGIDSSLSKDAAFEWEHEMESALELPVRRTHISRDAGVKFSGNAAASSWRPDIMDAALAIAVGPEKGVKNLNLRKGRFEREHDWGRHKKEFIRTGILAGIFLTIFFLNFTMGIRNKEKTIAHLDHQMALVLKNSFPGGAQAADPLNFIKKRIKDKKEETLPSNEAKMNHLMIDMLYAISRNIPKGMDVTFLKFSSWRNGFEVTGDAGGFNDVDGIKSRLEKSGMFQTVVIHSAKADKRTRRVKFQLKAQINLQSKGGS